MWVYQAEKGRYSSKRQKHAKVWKYFNYVFKLSEDESVSGFITLASTALSFTQINLYYVLNIWKMSTCNHAKTRNVPGTEKRLLWLDHGVGGWMECGGDSGGRGRAQFL